jgi:hypothetical protein
VKNTKDNDHEIQLASKWTISKVALALENDDRKRLVKFMDDRYTERFFIHMKVLEHAKEGTSGFAIMALCSLLIETLQCYRWGYPSTNECELKKCIKEGKSLGSEYRLDNVTKTKSLGCEAFQAFFENYSALFPDVDGAEFYRSVRNGLLHQAQTKNGWLIRVAQGQL